MKRQPGDSRGEDVELDQELALLGLCTLGQPRYTAGPETGL